MSNTRRKQALGKGLGALLGQPPAARQEVPTASPAAVPDTPKGDLLELPVASISPNPRQPRQHFDTEGLEELAESIRTHGVLQPILVMRGEFEGEYTLLAGERRLRASEIAGRGTIPARIVTPTESEQLEFALIENVQREDLDPVEEARAYQELQAVFGHSQEKIAKRVGKSRVAIANSLRLLKLSDGCLSDLQSGNISPGHARAILMLHHPLQQELLRAEIVDKGLTVRQAEERARAIQLGEPEPSAKGARKAKKEGSGPQEDLDVVALEEKLTLCLGCKVRIRTRTGKSGTIQIAYQTLDDLDRVLDLFGVNPDD